MWRWLFVFGGLCMANTASAYSWFVRDGYTHCVQCHADPSGSGLLTPYGRAQSELFMRTHYGVRPAEETEPGAVKDFMWGAVELPEFLLMQADLRGGVATDGSTAHFFESQADIEAQAQIDRYRATASLGYAHEDALQTRLTNFAQDNLVARQYWLGVDLGEDDETLLRVGRIALPFGLRTSEQRLLVHDLARDNLIDQQQLGIAASYNSDVLRAEAMAYIGNPQQSSWARWEHGGSAYVEWSPLTTVALGASGLVAHSDVDVQRSVALYRGAYGLFARYAPFHAFVLMAEFDGATEQAASAPVRSGYAAFLQVDFLVYEGLHLMGAAEALSAPVPDASSQGRGRVAVDWFFLPHAEVRVDGIFTDVAGELVAALHVYL